MKEFFKKLVIRELGWCANYVYRKFHPYVVAVTGSSGKTTTKYMIGELLDGVVKDIGISRSNLNSQYGLPLLLLGYKASPSNFLDWASVVITSPFRALLMSKCKKIMILEYASDKPGDLDHLSKIVPPDIVIITNIGVAHLEAFKKIEAIAKEKWSLALSASDKIICTKKVEEVVKDLPPARVDMIIAGGSKTAQAINVVNHKNNMQFDLIVRGKLYKNMELKLLGKHNIENLLISLCCAISLSGETVKIIENIRKIEPLEGRGQRFIARNGAMIIDESYNANPASMLATVSNLSASGFGRKVIIMGEMKELGSISKKAHVEVSILAKKAADYCVGVGGGFEGLGLDKWYASVEQLIKDVDSLIGDGDTVLIKGSHSVGLELLVKRLKEE